MKESKEYRVKPGSKVHLSEWDPEDTRGVDKDEAKAEQAKLDDRLNELQEMLYATGDHALLIVLQGMDTSGKDGVIKNVVGAMNPQGCDVISFKVPTAEELAHDFLWRVHKAVPRRGKVGIFNRSHYEDVLVQRVDDLVPERVWQKRYDAINDFERLLSENGMVIAKFFLHISPEKQKEKLLDRLQDPKEQWKFRVGDLKARAQWDEYERAYEDAISRCSTDYAPWYIVPANKRWYRNLVVSRIVEDLLEGLKMEWPPLEAEAEGIVIE